MNICVIGPGSLGCLFAGYLARAGHAVTLIDHDADRAKRLGTSGVTIESDGGSFQVSVSAATSVPAGCELQIVAVKAHRTESLKLAAETPVLTLQNGLGNVETLCEMVGSSYVIAGTTSEGAHLTAEGKVTHAGRGVTVLGSWTSCPVDAAIEALSDAGFTVESTDAPGQALWEKAAINAGINPITALLGIENGRILEIPEARQLMRDLVVEAVKVSGTEGYRFNRSLVEIAEDTCELTKNNRSSMLQDVQANRQTEIKAITGEILRRAQMAGLPTPRTRVIYQLLRGLEQR